jgi:hypothetical protein
LYISASSKDVSGQLGGGFRAPVIASLARRGRLPNDVPGTCQIR